MIAHRELDVNKAGARGVDTIFTLSLKIAPESLCLAIVTAVGANGADVMQKSGAWDFGAECADDFPIHVAIKMGRGPLATAMVHKVIRDAEARSALISCCDTAGDTVLTLAIQFGMMRLARTAVWCVRRAHAHACARMRALPRRSLRLPTGKCLTPTLALSRRASLSPSSPLVVRSRARLQFCRAISNHNSTGSDIAAIIAGSPLKAGGNMARHPDDVAQTVRLLAHRGAGGASALHLAIRRGQLEFATYLLRTTEAEGAEHARAMLTQRDNCGETCLHSIACVDPVGSAGASIAAAAEADCELLTAFLETLLHMGADAALVTTAKTARGGDGGSGGAESEGARARGASARVGSEVKGQSALHYCAARGAQTHWAVSTLLKSDAALASLRDARGDRLVDAAIRAGNHALAKVRFCVSFLWASFSFFVFHFCWLPFLLFAHLPFLLCAPPSSRSCCSKPARRRTRRTRKGCCRCTSPRRAAPTRAQRCAV